MDDIVLLESWGQGNRDAGMTLFDRYYGTLARFFHNKVNEAAAPDLIQDTFLGCVEGRERFRRDSSFRSYLFAIAHNLLRKHYRQQRTTAELLDFSACSAEELAPSPSEIAGIEQEQRLLLKALRRIPIECQEVLELHYWEQMSTTEIGEVVGVPAGTVKSRLQRGRRMLDEKMREIAQSPEILESTISHFDRWALGLRQRLLGRE